MFGKKREWCSRGQIAHRKVLGGGADEVVVMVVMSGTSTKVCSMCVGANVLRVGVVGKFQSRCKSVALTIRHLEQEAASLHN